MATGAAYNLCCCCVLCIVVGASSTMIWHHNIMRVYHLPSVVTVLAASVVIDIEAATIDVVHRSSYQGIRAAESVNITTTSVPSPSAAPTIYPSVQKVSASSVPSSVDPAASDNSMSINSATASDSATIPDSLQEEIEEEIEEEKSGIFGMSLFQTCAAVILIAMIVGLVGHFGMKLLPYNRRREDIARRNDVRIEDSLASFRSIPRASSSSYVGNNIQLQDSLDSVRSNVGV